MVKKDTQLEKVHFLTKGKFFIVCIIALLLMVAYLFGKSNNSYLEGTNIQEPTPTLEPTETPTQTYIPTDTPIPAPYHRTNLIIIPSPAPIIIQSNNNSIEEEQKIQNIENCQKQMNDYNSCMNTDNTNHQNYSNCIAQYNLEEQRYQEQIANGERFLVSPINSCLPVPISFCLKPNCLY